MFASLDDPVPKDNITCISKVDEVGTMNENAETAAEPNCASPSKTVNPFSLEATDTSMLKAL